jgi:hypothetical protein
VEHLKAESIGSYTLSLFLSCAFGMAALLSACASRGTPDVLFSADEMLLLKFDSNAPPADLSEALIVGRASRRDMQSVARLLGAITNIEGGVQRIQFENEPGRTRAFVTMGRHAYLVLEKTAGQWRIIERDRLSSSPHQAVQEHGQCAIDSGSDSLRGANWRAASTGMHGSETGQRRNEHDNSA